MRKTRNVEPFYITWRGIRLLVTFERNWLSSDNPITAHLQITSKDRVPLPITGTGYRSHFVTACQVDEQGGPVAYVLAWLEAESHDTNWIKEEQARRQLSLF